MTKAPEFADNETDRATVAAVLTAAGRPRGASDDLAEMNRQWDALAPGLAKAPDAEFDVWEAALIAALSDGPAEVQVRANELLAHLIGWRLGDV